MTDSQLAMLVEAQRAGDEVAVLTLLTDMLTDALTDMRDGYPVEVAETIGHLSHWVPGARPPLAN